MEACQVIAALSAMRNKTANDARRVLYRTFLTLEYRVRELA